MRTFFEDLSSRSTPISSIPIGLALIGILHLGADPAGAGAPECDDSLRIGGTLPLPCTLPLADYEQVLYTWINDFEYTRLGWVRDRNVRDTGPNLFSANYGTHPAVRIYYSPEVSSWLEGGRDGNLPIGSMIVKEMYNPPAARWEEQRPADCEEGCETYDGLLRQNIGSWTIMIKDGQTHDGWFWAGPSRVSPAGKTREEYEKAIAATRDTNNYPFEFRASDHGQASCLRCHSTSDGEFTFASLKNIEGDELRFRVDNSWRSNLAPEQRPAGGEGESDLLQDAYHGNTSASIITPDGKDLVEDPLRVRGPASRPFDAEGIAGRAQSIVEDGRLVRWVLDCATARKLGLETTGNARRGLAALAGVQALLAMLGVNALSDLSIWQRGELLLTTAGAVMLAAGHLGWRSEGARPSGTVSFNLSAGSLLAAGPLVLGLLINRADGELTDWAWTLMHEVGVLSVGLALVGAGVLCRVRSTTLVGAASLVAYVASMVVLLDVPDRLQNVAVYMMVGGGAFFGTAVLLSVYRDRLLQIPDRIRNGDGVFRVLTWR